MNVAAAPPPAAPPVAETGSAAVGAGQAGAPAGGFEALLAQLGAEQPADEGDIDLKGADDEAAPATDAATVVGDPTALLAIMMAAQAPAPAATPTVEADLVVAVAGAAPAPTLPLSEAHPAAPAQAEAQAAVGPNASETAQAAIAAAAETVAATPAVSGPAATTPAAEKSPVLQAALAQAAPAAAAPAADKPAAPNARAQTASAEPGRGERAQRAEPSPVGEARSAARSVETETVDAVAAVAATTTAGGDAAQAAPSPKTDAAQPILATAQTAAGASVDTPAAAAPVHETRGSPETVAKLSADILKKLDGRSTRFEVALDPVGLGHVDVKIEISRHGEVTAALSFDTPQAAAELRGRAAELRAALGQAGFDLAENALSFDVANQGGGGQRQAFAFQDQPGRSPAFVGRAFQAATEGAETLVDTLSSRLVAARGGVDVRI